MAKEIIGDACAYIPGVNGVKNRYFKIGTGMRDGDRISVKIDTIPLPGLGWDGWVNIFPRQDPLGPVPAFAGPPPARQRRPPGPSGFDDLADDIPF